MWASVSAKPVMTMRGTDLWVFQGNIKLSILSSRKGVKPKFTAGCHFLWRVTNGCAQKCADLARIFFKVLSNGHTIIVTEKRIYCNAY